MTSELTKAAQQALEALSLANQRPFGETCPVREAINALEDALTQRPAAQTEREAFEARLSLESIIKQYRIKAEDANWLRASLPTPQQDDDDGDVTGQPGPLPETGWDEAPAGAFRKPSPTAGMNLGERIKHVGGRENAAGYIEFGSVAAVRALVRQYLRDEPAPQQATPGWSYAQVRVVDEKTVDIGRVVAFADERATPEPTVTYATVRDAEDELHIECRFSDGQKFAAVTVAQGFDNLAHRIETMLNGAQQATPEPVGEPAFWVLTKQLQQRETTTRGYMWFSNPQNDSWTPVFTRPAPVETELVGEPAMVVEQLRSGAIDVLERTLPIGVHKLYTRPAPGVPEDVLAILDECRSALMECDRDCDYALIDRIDALAAAQAKGAGQ